MSAGSAIFSSHWYRVAHLHPRLLAHVQLDRHRYRGETWYVLRDGLTGRSHRVNWAAYRIVGRLDGRLSVQQIWESALEELGDDAPTQGEVIGLLGRLHQAELIQSEVSPDVGVVFQQGEARRRRQRGQRLNPMAFRVGLVDPSRLLDRLAPRVRWLFSPTTLVVWMALIATALATAFSHAAELRVYASLHLMTPGMLLLVWLCYPPIKALHELGHALAVRFWGGEVHEMGISLLVVMPVPYVDASAASTFRARHRRVIVSLMGIFTELALACLAVLVWANAADGVVRELAFAVMMVGGVSTLLVNGNPLMRFDAYYALADAIEIPGLAQRSARYLGQLAERWLLGARRVDPIVPAQGERRWLIGYGGASIAYRYVIFIGITDWLLSESVALGTAFGLFASWFLLWRPSWRFARHLRESPAIRQHRTRAYSSTALIGALVLSLVFLAPITSSTRVDGVVWTPDEARVRAEVAGFVAQVLVAHGQKVDAGQPLLALHDPNLFAERARTLAQLRALDTAYQTALSRSPVEARVITGEIARQRNDLALLDGRIAMLTVRSAVAGRVALARPQDLVGSFVQKGTVLGHVIAAGDLRIRAVVGQDDIVRVRDRTRQVQVLLAEDTGRERTARRDGDIPAAVLDLPSPALGDRGGGPWTTDPADPQGVRSLDPVFLVDLVAPGEPLQRVGGRAWVRFVHDAEPVGVQMYRRVRQVFLRHLGRDQA